MAKKTKIDFSDIRHFENDLNKEISAMPNRLRKAVKKAVTLVHSQAVSNTRAGVLYPDGVYETGNLRRSLSFDVLSDRKGKVYISKGLKYPLYVEKGTRRMDPKPFLSPAVEKKREQVNNIFKKAIEQSFNNLVS